MPVILSGGVNSFTVLGVPSGAVNVMLTPEDEITGKSNVP
jgi:hypothetical protein